MTSKERFLKAINREEPDRLPVTTHHIMPYFLNKYMRDISYQEFFDYFGLDPIKWIVVHKPNEEKGDYFDPTQEKIGFLETRRICNDNWKIKTEQFENHSYETQRISFITPKKTLSMILRNDDCSTWVVEHLIKKKSDIDILANYTTVPICDVGIINKTADEFGERGLIRGHICCFDGFGQPGCWQDAACLFGIENLIIETFDDPNWVHTFLGILKERKKSFILSLKGANYDLIELGGGDASTTVISPKIFNDFVAPYDSELIALTHQVGLKIVYHTCGGMMPILEDIAQMNPDAMETFTPHSLGGDVSLREAKRRIGDKVCMIGGFDQFHYFLDCDPQKTKNEVRRCFEEAGDGGGFILSPSDHFFDADLNLIKAFADESQKCKYN